MYILPPKSFSQICPCISKSITITTHFVFCLNKCLMISLYQSIPNSVDRIIFFKSQTQSSLTFTFFSSLMFHHLPLCIFSSLSGWFTILHSCHTTNFSLEWIRHPFIIKTLNTGGLEGTYLNIIQATHDKPKGKIVLNDEELKAFPLRSERRQGCPLSPLLFNKVLELWATAIRQEKKK